MPTTSASRPVRFRSRAGRERSPCRRRRRSCRRPAPNAPDRLDAHGSPGSKPADAARSSRAPPPAARGAGPGTRPPRPAAASPPRHPASRVRAGGVHRAVRRGARQESALPSSRRRTHSSAGRSGPVTVRTPAPTAAGARAMLRPDRRGPHEWSSTRRGPGVTCGDGWRPWRDARLRGSSRIRHGAGFGPSIPRARHRTRPRSDIAEQTMKGAEQTMNGTEQIMKGANRP